MEENKVRNEEIYEGRKIERWTGKRGGKIEEH